MPHSLIYSLLFIYIISYNCAIFSLISLIIFNDKVNDIIGRSRLFMFYFIQFHYILIIYIIIDYI